MLFEIFNTQKVKLKSFFVFRVVKFIIIYVRGKMSFYSNSMGETKTNCPIDFSTELEF